MAHADSANFRGNFIKEMHGDKKCPFNGVISYSRVWRKNAQKQGLEYEKDLCFLNCIKLSGSSKAQWKKMPTKRYPPDSSEEREDDELMEEPREEVEEVVPVEHSLMLRSWRKR